MIEWLNPGLIYIFGALLIPLLKGKLQKAYMLMLPIVALIDLMFMREGTYWSFSVSEYVLTFGSVDKLSIVFAYVFVIASFCMTLYALHVKGNGQHVAAFLYIGGALGVVFAGDLFSLYIFWEIMAWASLCLIWYRKTKASSEAGFRYIMVHLFGGICLLAGIILHVQNTGSIAFNVFDWGLGWGYMASYFILVGFLINAAVPPLHAWLADAYPEATITGAVFLSAFTTKSAIYVLIRGFPHVELLIWLGAIMAIYGVIFAVLENDARRLLAYSIISQGGYMLVGIGIGTTMAINGAVAHAFCCVLYMALLFMGAGAVLEMTGRSKFTELGGLYKYKYMPSIFGLYMIGAFAISGLPLFSGFISKTMVIESTAHMHLPVIWLMLEGAAIGTFLVAALKLPYLTWFARKEPLLKVKALPKNMFAAMGIVAALSVLIGVYPQALYKILPYQPVEYAPYAVGHLVAMSQLLLFSFMAFALLWRKLQGTKTITLDIDWVYRLAGKKFIWFCEKPLLNFARDIDKVMKDLANSFIRFSRNPMAISMLLITATSTRLLTPFYPEYRQKGLELVEAKKREVEEPMEKMSIGMGVMLVLIFFAFYLLIYLTHGVLWR